MFIPAVRTKAATVGSRHTLRESIYVFFRLCMCVYAYLRVSERGTVAGLH